MDPRRKRIYVIIIAVCGTLSAGLLFWTYFLSGVINAPDQGLTPGSFTPVASEASGNTREGFAAPSVFPVSEGFDSDVLQSTAFKKLKPYKAADVTGQLGRPDPFRSY